MTFAPFLPLQGTTTRGIVVILRLFVSALILPIALILTLVFTANCRHSSGVLEDLTWGDWLDAYEGPERDAWQQPDRVVEELKLRPTDIVADIGAATGYFSLRLAKEVPQGRVWGVDIEPPLVRFLALRAQRQRLNNVFSILGRPDNPLIPERVDLVLMVNVYHLLNEREAYLENLKGFIKPKGRIAIIEHTLDSRYGPAFADRLARNQIIGEMERAGFKLLRSSASLKEQIYLVFATQS